MEIKEVRVRVSLTSTFFKDVVPKVVAQHNNQQAQQIDARVNLNEAITNEPTVDIPQEAALRKSQRKKRPSISDDYLVYLHESDDLGIDNDPVLFSQAIESNNSVRGINE